MMLQPKRTKYKKEQKGRIGRIAQRGHTLAFGSYGLKVLEGGWITARQIEAVRVALTRTMKREGIIWRRIFPSKPMTRKAAGTRMGSGKGSHAFFVAVVKPGTIIYEAEGISKELAEKAFYLASKKLPMKTKMIVHNDL